MNKLLSLTIRNANEDDVKNVKKQLEEPKIRTITTTQIIEEKKEEVETEEEEVRKEEPKKEKEKKEKEKVEVQYLSMKEIERLYQRLPKFEDTEKHGSDFFQREKTIPLPTVGKIISVAFPPTGPPQNIEKAKTTKVNEELFVQSFKPEGKHGDRRRPLSFTFSEPMYRKTLTMMGKAVTNNKEYLDRRLKNVVKNISFHPLLPDGKWHWSTANTIIFNPKGNSNTVINDEGIYVGACKYDVVVEKTMKSYQGATIKKPFIAHFSTPEIRPRGYLPNSGANSRNGLPKNALVGIMFSLEVDPKEVFKKLRCEEQKRTETHTIHRVKKTRRVNKGYNRVTRKYDYIDETYYQWHWKVDNASKSRKIKMKFVSNDDAAKRMNTEDFFIVQPNGQVRNFKDSAIYGDQRTEEGGIKKYMKTFNERCVFFEVFDLQYEISHKERNEIISQRCNYTHNVTSRCNQSHDPYTLYFYHYTVYIPNGIRAIKPGSRAILSTLAHSFNFKGQEQFHYVNTNHSTLNNYSYHDIVTFNYNFNNFLSPSIFEKEKEKWVTTKNLENAFIWVKGKTIFVKGRVKRFSKRTTVTVTKYVADCFGNRLKDSYKDKNGFTINSSVLERKLSFISHPHNQHYTKNCNWRFKFNLPLDTKDNEIIERLVTVKPRLKNQKLRISGDSIYVSGDPSGAYLPDYPYGVKKFDITIAETLNSYYDLPLEKVLKKTVRIIASPIILRSRHNHTLAVQDITNKSIPIWYRFNTRNIDNIKVLIFQVDPILHFQKSPLGKYSSVNSNNLDYYKRCGIPKNKCVYDKTMKTHSIYNEEKEIIISELDKYLENKKDKIGHILISIFDIASSHNISYWLQCTKLGIETVITNDNSLALIGNSLIDGKVITDGKFDVSFCESSRVDKKMNIKTDKNGVGIFDLNQVKKSIQFHIFCFNYKNDKVFVANCLQHIPRQNNRLIPFCFDDKKIYKPNETVKVKGILRKLQFIDHKRELVFIKKDEKIKYEIKDGRNIKLKDDKLKVNEFSGFYLEYKLPDNANLGTFKIQFTIDTKDKTYSNKVFNHTFKVEEFKAPEFKIATEILPKEEVVINQNIVAVASAKYHSGGVLSNCNVYWTITQKIHNFTSSKFSGFNFLFNCNSGRRILSSGFRNYNDAPKTSYSWTGQTDTTGEHKVFIQCRNSKQFEVTRGPMTYSDTSLANNKGDIVTLPIYYDKINDIYSPVKVQLKTRIQDLSQNQLECVKSCVVHPCQYYVGIKLKKNYVHLGQDINFEIVVVDHKGNAVKDIPVVIELYQYNKKMKSLNIKSSDQPSEHKMELFLEWLTGQYSLVASVLDNKKLKNSCSKDFNVTYQQSQRNRDQDIVNMLSKLNNCYKDYPKIYNEFNIPVKGVQLTFDKDIYNVKDKLKVLIKSEIKGEGVLFMISNKILCQKKFIIKSRENLETSLEFEITPEYIPNCRALAIVTGNNYRKDLNDFDVTPKDEKDISEQPDHAKGFADFDVETTSNYKLKVEVSPERDVVKPSTETKINVKVNRPNSVVTCLVVDEAVLALTKYKLDVPIKNFYPKNIIQTYEYFLRNHIGVRKCKANLQKVEDEKKRLLKEKEKRDKENAKKLEELRKREEEKRLRDAEQARLSQINKPPPPPVVQNTFRNFEKKRFIPVPKPIPMSRGGGGMFKSSMRMPSRPMKSSMARKKKKSKKMDMSSMAFGGGRAPPKRKAMPMSSFQPAPQRNIQKQQQTQYQPSISNINMEEDTNNTPISLRKLFESTVVFTKSIRTDSDGKVEIKIKMPDNLSSFAIWCVAESEGGFFGFGESKITAKLPFSVRSALPQFLNYGDSIDMRFILNNHTSSSMNVKCAIRVGKNLLLTDEKNRGFYVKLPKLDRTEVNFNIKTKEIGKAVVQVAASTPEHSDAIEEKVNIYTPACKNSSFMIHGDMDPKCLHVQKIIPPSTNEVYTGFGGLVLTTSSTIFQNLTDAYLYVSGYEHDCVEQCSSRLLSIFSQIEFVEKFQMKDFGKISDLEKKMKVCLDKLYKGQRSNGTFGFWYYHHGYYNEYISTHVAHAVIRVREKYPKLFNTTKNKTLLNRCKSYCINANSYWGRSYGYYTRRSIRGKSLFVLGHFARLGLLSSTEKNRVKNRINSLYSELGSEPRKNATIETLAWLAYSVYYICGKKDKKVDKLIRVINQSLVDLEDEKAYYSSSVIYNANYNKLVMVGSSSIRENGVALEVMCALQPKNKFLVKICKFILSNKRKGRWGNTNENVYALYGLSAYLKTFEKHDPNFTCNVWLENEYCGGINFKGRDKNYKVLEIPMEKIVISPEEQLENERKKEMSLKFFENERIKREQKLNKKLKDDEKSLKVKEGSSTVATPKTTTTTATTTTTTTTTEIPTTKDAETTTTTTTTSTTTTKKKTKKGGLFSSNNKVDDEDMSFLERKIMKKDKKKDIIVEKKTEIKVERKTEVVERKIVKIKSESENLKGFLEVLKKRSEMMKLESDIDDLEEQVLDDINKKKLTMQTHGKGKCYYKVGMRYAPKDLKAIPQDYGFSNVMRTYHYITKPDDVVKCPRTNTYTVKLGSLIRVRVQFTIPHSSPHASGNSRYHIACVDKVPAGFEILNPALATTVTIPVDNDHRYRNKWYDHHNYRFERCECFKEVLYNGTYYFSYVCRAKYTGKFIALPLNVECMYEEDIWGQSQTDTVNVIK